MSEQAVKPIETFEEFLPFYISEHANPVSRVLHYIGTVFGWSIIIYFLMSETPYLFPLGFVFGYSCAWIGHFGFEKNKPATFKYPGWSFISDYFMIYYAITGQMNERLAEAQKIHPPVNQ